MLPRRRNRESQRAELSRHFPSRAIRDNRIPHIFPFSIDTRARCSVECRTVAGRLVPKEPQPTLSRGERLKAQLVPPLPNCKTRKASIRSQNLNYTFINHKFVAVARGCSTLLTVDQSKVREPSQKPSSISPPSTIRDLQLADLDAKSDLSERVQRVNSPLRLLTFLLFFLFLSRATYHACVHFDIPRVQQVPISRSDIA